MGEKKKLSHYENEWIMPQFNGSMREISSGNKIYLYTFSP